MLDPAALRGRLNGVRERIARAAQRANRDPASIRLIAISKTFPADCVLTAFDAGQLDFGENKVQEALPKIQQTSTLPLRWHLVGHLQSNKARRAAASFDAIHSIDSPVLLQNVDEAAGAAGRQIDVLIQVDLGREPTKHGAPPEGVAAIVEQAASCRGARLAGLMTLPPTAADPEEARPYFAALRDLRDRLVAAGAEPTMLTELSMGMSHDFEVAVEEGATMVRVGSAIFGDRTIVANSER